MANSFLTYTNDVLAKLNEVQLTSTDFGDARGIQIQAKMRSIKLFVILINESFVGRLMLQRKVKHLLLVW